MGQHRPARNRQQQTHGGNGYSPPTKAERSSHGPDNQSERWPSAWDKDKNATSIGSRDLPP